MSQGLPLQCLHVFGQSGAREKILTDGDAFHRVPWLVSRLILHFHQDPRLYKLLRLYNARGFSPRPGSVLLRLYILAPCILIFGRPFKLLVCLFPTHPLVSSVPCFSSSAHNEFDARLSHPMLDSTHPLIRCTSPISLMLGSRIRFIFPLPLFWNLLLPQICCLNLFVICSYGLSTRLFLSLLCS